MAIFGTLGEINLSAISASISDTAVDVFVYDTTKDSDGGAWRKKTKETSWYNETLNTSVRGSRREFPAVAVIVAESQKVTIYDGDDPDLPMWMVFTPSTSTAANYLSLSTQVISSVSMLNGDLCVGFPSTSGWGISRIQFPSDSQYWLWATSRLYYSKAKIVGRNAGVSYYAGGLFGGLSNAGINDVAMAVLPNGFNNVDPCSGLPIPTLALASAQGVQLVRPDLSVFQVNDNTGARPASKVLFRGETLTWNNTANGSIQNRWRISNIDSDAIGDAGGVWRYNITVNGGDPTIENPTALLYGANRFMASDLNDDKKLFVGTNTSISSTGPQSGLSIVIDGKDRDSNYAPLTITDSMVAHITSDYNTGYQHGDCKGAFLNDTSTDADFGPELVTGGDFSNASDWTLGTGWSINGSNQAEHTGSAGYLEQVGSFTSGQYYQLTADLVSGGAATNFGISNHHDPTTTQPHNNSSFVDVYCVDGGTKIYAMWKQRPGVNLTAINLYANNSGTMVIDNVSIKKINKFIYDRSVNNQRLAGMGTLTKTPVATGSELVAYSGFSSDDYLVATYDAEMEFGTDDFYMMAWIKNNDNTNNQKIITRDLNNSNRCQFYTAGNFVQIFIQDPGGQSYLQSITEFDQNIWMQYIVGRKNGTLYMYVDGKAESGTGSNTSSPARNLSFGAGTPLEIGRSQTAPSNFFKGSIALARVGKGFPTDDQAKKMYDDEKCLFQENAIATLYGSSNGVTAIDYDEITNQVHVGTSVGRSDFLGLNRINNTTTAVTTAISAHDSLIIEQ